MAAERYLDAVTVRECGEGRGGGMPSRQEGAWKGGRGESTLNSGQPGRTHGICRHEHLAVLVAAVAGFAFGAVYYMSLSRQWLAAVGKTKEELAASARRPPSSSRSWR